MSEVDAIPIIKLTRGQIQHVIAAPGLGWDPSVVRALAQRIVDLEVEQMADRDIIDELRARMADILEVTRALVAVRPVRLP